MIFTGNTEYTASWEEQRAAGQRLRIEICFSSIPIKKLIKRLMLWYNDPKYQAAGPLVVCIGLLMLAIGLLLSAINSSRRLLFYTQMIKGTLHRQVSSLCSVFVIKKRYGNFFGQGGTYNSIFSLKIRSCWDPETLCTVPERMHMCYQM